MSKALEMGKTSAAGSFYLLLGVAGSTIIMAIGTLVLAGLLPVSEVGLYGIALIPSSIIGYFRDWGVNSALTQRIASLREAGKQSEIHDVIYSGIIFEVVTGAVLSAICFGLAAPLAFFMSPSNEGSLFVYISIMSLSIFAGALFAAASGIFVGFERMKLNSLTQILQALVKTAFGPLLIVLGFGVLGAIWAAAASFIVGGVVGVVLVYFALYRQVKKCKVGKCDVKQTLKPLLLYGLPLTVSGIVTGVLPQVSALFMALYTSTWMMGNYYASAYFPVLLTFIYLPITTALFPVFSRINPEKEPELIKKVFATSAKYASFLLVPATLALIILSGPLINTLFPQNGVLRSLTVVNAAPKFPYAPLFLSVTVLVNLLVLVGNFAVSSFQTGIGKTRQVMYQSLLSAVVGVPATYLLVWYFRSIGGEALAIVGGLLGTIVTTIPSVSWAIYWSWKHYGVKADFKISAKILVAAATASIAAFLFITALRLPYVVELIGGLAIFLVVYLTCAPLMGAVNYYDVENFKELFSSLGALSKILNFPLLFMRKMCRPTGGGKVCVKENQVRHNT